MLFLMANDAKAAVVEMRAMTCAKRRVSMCTQ